MYSEIVIKNSRPMLEKPGEDIDTQRSLTEQELREQATSELFEQANRDVQPLRNFVIEFRPKWIVVNENLSERTTILVMTAIGNATGEYEGSDS